MHAKQLGVDKTIFIGSFLENNKFAMRTLSYALDFWSSGTVRAIFLKVGNNALITNT
jgi:type II pantothenate kinase